MRLAFELVDKGLVPDPLIRTGIRRLLRRRLRQISAHGDRDLQTSLDEIAAAMRKGPVAPSPRAANEQHYEVPAEFFRVVLGKRLKYSCALWRPGTGSLDQAEEAMLCLTAERAGIEDGMQLLELGCGWGSLSLWLAEQFPACRILSVSNSESQRAAIEAARVERHLDNLEIWTSDMNDFTTDRRFDRVVSVEMFEHMRNYEELLRRVRSWLEPEGRFFMHVFSHRKAAYFFEDAGPDDWMSRHFFTGGLMPTDALLERFQGDLEISETWSIDGRHYQQTCRAWLANLDRHHSHCLEIFAGVYGDDHAKAWLNRWRVFFLSCAELFGYRDGHEWLVSHSLWAPRENARRVA